MLGKLRQKVGTSISEITVPDQFLFSEWLRLPRNILLVFYLLPPKIGVLGFTFSHPPVSDNICLKTIKSLLETSIFVKNDTSGTSQLFENYQNDGQIDLLPIPKIFQELNTLQSTVLEYLLLTSTSNHEIPVRFSSDVNTYKILPKSIFHDESIVDLTDTFVWEEIPSTNFEITLLSPSPIYEIEARLIDTGNTYRIVEKAIFLGSEIIDLADALAWQVEISSNLFAPIGQRNPEGANYRSSQEKRQELFTANQNSKGESIGGHRKAYTIEKTTRSTTVKRQSIWDLLYPLLLPPLTFEYAEQFDLYKPLFGYQQEGIEFLVKNTSALLADEMGTGKTVQTIIALRILFRQGKVKSALVLAPVAALGSAELSLKTGQSEGWDGHLHHWAPELSVTVVRGDQEQRRMDWNCPAHVCITTFDTLRNDIKHNILKDDMLQKFECVIVDEAQNIKIKKSGRAKAVKRLKSKYRWALTGTPIENKVEDVISIFDFIRPGHFTQEYHPPQEVKSGIAPYFLRRLKRDVMKDLPEKIRQEEWLELDAEQQAEYNRVIASGRVELAETVKSKSESQVRMHIFQLLQKLKQICNFASHQYASPKTDLLLDHIEAIRENGEKVLVFSQYEKFGIERLERLLKDKEIGFVTYKGGLTDRQRDEVVSNFRKNDEIPVFLATVRAAGVAITLTEASYVIHFDHWWNPAVMWQAEDRAHRHGQTKCLNVYSFWMKETIEEKIKEKLQQKGLLIESVIDSLATEIVEEMISTAEWLQMLGVESKAQAKESFTVSLEDALERLRKISPRDFEEKSKEFLVKLGYLNAKVTQYSRDGGIDVFGSRKINEEGEEVIVAQCKRMDSVGVTVARELLGIMAANEKISKGFILTTGVFSEDCRRFAAANPKLNLIDGLTLSNYLIQFKLI